MSRKRIAMIMTAMSLVFSSVPVCASGPDAVPEAVTESGAAAESVTEPAAENPADDSTVPENKDTGEKENGAATESAADGTAGSQGDTGEKEEVPVPAICKVSVGYFFEDGSFDEWTSGNAFSVGKYYLATPVINNISESGDIFQAAKTSRGDAYKNFGIDVNDYKTMSANIGYALQTESGIVRLKKTERVNEAFTVLSDGEYHEGYKMANRDYRDGDVLTLSAPSGTYPVKLTETYQNKGYTYFTLTGDMTALAAGCPVMLEDRSVIGIVTGIGKDSATAVMASAVTSSMDAAGIDYDIMPLSGNEPGTDSGDDEKADRLFQLIVRAEGIDTTGYTEESVKAFEDALRTARETIDSGGDYDAALEGLQTAIDGLKERPQRRSIGKIAALITVVVAAGLLIAVIYFLLPKLMNRPEYLIEEDESDKEEARRRRREEKKRARQEKERQKKEKSKKGKKKKSGRDDDYNVDEPISRKMDRQNRNREDSFRDGSGTVNGGRADAYPDTHNAPQEPDWGTGGSDSRTGSGTGTAGAYSGTRNGAQEPDRGTGENRTGDRNTGRNDGGGNSGDGRWNDWDSSGSWSGPGRFGTTGGKAGHTPEKKIEDDSEANTSVLSDSEAETSILDNPMPKARLVKKSDGSRIPVTGQQFVIGKSAQGTDYRIEGNTTISRRHAKIIFKDGIFAISDMNSKNGTFVNGKRLEPGSSVTLSPGDTVTLSDAEFVFESDGNT